MDMDCTTWVIWSMSGVKIGMHLIIIGYLHPETPKGPPLVNVESLGEEAGDTKSKCLVVQPGVVSPPIAPLTTMVFGWLCLFLNEWDTSAIGEAAGKAFPTKA